MDLAPVSFLPPVGAPLPAFDSAPAAGNVPGLGVAGDFASWMRSQAAETQRLLTEADRQVVRLASGDTDNLHQVMLSLEEARLQFQLLTQVRNRVLEAYQDVLRMQV